ncbi:MAG: hypothetical protein J1E83_13595 [Lachnospiraceae bacterium]|nr:hypothetical protein [Lachnospiraceae bacterium]
MGKVLGVIGTILVAFAIFCYLFFGKGFGLGNGKGDGDGNANAVSNEQDVKESEPQNEISEGTGADNEITVVIEVKQSQYLVDGKEMTLSEIESLIQGYDLENTSFIIEDNYAAAKAWDEIKDLFLSYEVSVVEQ